MFMIQLLLLQTELVAKRLGLLLQRLGHQLIAIGIAVLLPLGLMLGLAFPSERNGKPLKLEQQPLANLLHLLPLVRYGEVPQVNATDRRGAMAEKRTDRDQPWVWVVPPLETPASVLLPGYSLLIQLNVASPTYGTVLPSLPNMPSLPNLAHLTLSKPFDGLQPEVTVQPL